MKLLIAGSRSIKEFDLSPYITDDVDTILTGGADGIDKLAEKYADSHGIEKIIIKPNYTRFSRAAPLKRNEELVRKCDKALVIWDGKSKGSKHTADYARKLNKEVLVIDI